VDRGRAQQGAKRPHTSTFTLRYQADPRDLPQGFCNGPYLLGFYSAAGRGATDCAMSASSPILSLAHHPRRRPPCGGNELERQQLGIIGRKAGEHDALGAEAAQRRTGEG
jgi:hypothetical protein